MADIERFNDMMDIKGKIKYIKRGFAEIRQTMEN